jgi:hypothetical protein
MNATKSLLCGLLPISSISRASGENLMSDQLLSYLESALVVFCRELKCLPKSTQIEAIGLLCDPGSSPSHGKILEYVQALSPALAAHF